MRKSSPGKTLFSSATVLQSSLERSSTSPVRNLDFNSQAAPQSTQPPNQSANPVPLQSWADKVRGTTSSGHNTTAATKTTDAADRQSQSANSGSRFSSGSVNDCVVQDVNDGGDEEEGWETVHRGRKMHGNHSRKGNKSTFEQMSNGRTGTKSNHSRTEKTMNGTSSNGHAAGNQSVSKDVYNESTPCNLSPIKASENSVEISQHEEIETILDDNGYEEQASLSDIEHEKALSAATEEEESLTRQIEECQNQMIASVIEHEESLTKEIAEEKELVTAINGETESPVSDIEQKEETEIVNDAGDNSLNCSGTSNGDSVRSSFYQN